MYGARLEVEVVQRQASEDVVHDRLRHPHVRVVGEAGRLEAQVGELLHERLERDAVLQPDRDGDREGVHHAGQRRALLAELEEQLAEAVVRVGAGGEVALGPADRERRRLRRPTLREALADRAVLHDLLDDRLGGRRGLVRCGVLGRRPAVGEGLADLAVVAVDRERLEAELPALQVDVGDLLDRRGLRQVDRLADRAREERLRGRHHPHVTHRRDRTSAHRRVEHVVVLRLQARGVDDVTLVGDELDDRLARLGGVAELLQRPRDRQVDDLHRAAADELLELDQREVGLDARRVAVHHEADRPGRGEDRRLRVAVAVLLPDRHDVGPRLGGAAGGSTGPSRRACGSRRSRPGACA